MSKAKAYGALVAIVALWLLWLLTPFGWWQLTVTVYSRVTGHSRQYMFDLWYSNDQNINALLGGRPDHTISGRVYYHEQLGSQTAAELRKLIDAVFYLAIKEVDHCKNAIEWDEVQPLQRTKK